MAILRNLAMVGVFFATLSSHAIPAGAAPGGAIAPGAVPTLVGSSGAYTPTPGRPALGDLVFQQGDGTVVPLAAFKGKLVLLNLWATWCAPCVKEMGTLDTLAATLGGDRFQVVTLSEDRAGAKAVTPFLTAHKLAHLATWIDPKSAAMMTLRVQGLPTTLLIDAQGHELGRLEGDADWSSPQALALVRHYLAVK